MTDGDQSGGGLKERILHGPTLGWFNDPAGLTDEYISSEVLIGSAVSLTTLTSADITSISLTAGDWDVWGNVAYNPAGGTLLGTVAAWINTTSATFPTAPNKGAIQTLVIPPAVNNFHTISTGTLRLSLLATTTVYLSAYASFEVSTCSAYGYIGARRVR